MKKRRNFNFKILKKFQNIQLSLDYKKKKSKFIIKNDFTKKTATKYVNASQFSTYIGSVTAVAADNITTGDAAVTVGTSSGNITLDGAGDIILDADDANVTVSYTHLTLPTKA